MPSRQANRGFSLIEALVAALVVATGLAALARLVVLATGQAASARRGAAALALAQSQLEYLRAQAWSYDAGGAPLSSSELALSPPSTLTSDVPGFADQLDRFGAATSKPGEAHFRRRWAISRFAPDDDDTLLLRVCVFAAGRDGPADLAEACVWGIRTRKP